MTDIELHKKVEHLSWQVETLTEVIRTSLAKDKPLKEFAKSQNMSYTSALRMVKEGKITAYKRDPGKSRSTWMVDVIQTLKTLRNGKGQH